jgi:hypothetical protein
MKLYKTIINIIFRDLNSDIHSTIIQKHIKYQIDSIDEGLISAETNLRSQKLNT